MSFSNCYKQHFTSLNIFRLDLVRACTGLSRSRVYGIGLRCAIMYTVKICAVQWCAEDTATPQFPWNLHKTSSPDTFHHQVIHRLQKYSNMYAWRKKVSVTYFGGWKPALLRTGIFINCQYNTDRQCSVWNRTECKSEFVSLCFSKFLSPFVCVPVYLHLFTLIASLFFVELIGLTQKQHLCSHRER